MKKEQLTLRKMLQVVDLDNVYKLIHEKNVGSNIKSDLNKTIKTYSKVVKELLGKPKSRTFKYPICVFSIIEDNDVECYDVCLLNENYVKPPIGARPWGGKNPPEGFYNINLEKYNRYFAFGYTKWSRLIDARIVNEANLESDKLIAEILWELTFNGFTEEDNEQFMKDLKSSINKAKKEIKKGKYTKIPPKSKDGYTVVIPDIVQKQLDDIMSKENENKSS